MAAVQVQKVRAPTPPPDNRVGHAAWAHYVVAGLQRAGLAREQALLFAAHLARESGWGGNVFNFNFGNIKDYRANGTFYVLTDNLSYTDRYIAFPTIEAGLAYSVDLVRRLALYRRSWAKLMAGDPTWYGQLGLDGYYEGPPDPTRPGVHTRHNAATIVPVQNEYNDVLAGVRRYLAAPRPANSPYPDISVGFGLGDVVGIVLGGAAAWWVYKKFAAPRRNPREGDGSWFANCESSVRKRGGARDPKAVCASVARRKVGAKKLAQLAAKGRKRAVRQNPKDVPSDLYELPEPTPYPYPDADPTLDAVERERR